MLKVRAEVPLKNTPSNPFVATLLISSAGLALQLAETRILSVIYWQHLVYSILTVALLGFAVSGTALHLSKGLQRLDDKGFLRLCCLGFALSSLLSLIFITALAGDFFRLAGESFGALNIARLLSSYFIATFPFFFFGLLILGLLQRFPDRAGSIYRVNLVGSALGVLGYVLCFGWLGAVGFVVYFVFLPLALLALLYTEGAHRRATALILALTFVTGHFLDIVPDKHKQFWIRFPETEKTVEVSEWNALSRVDVISDRRGSHKLILIDGDAQAGLVPHPKRVLADTKFLHQGPLLAHGRMKLATKGWKSLTATFVLNPTPTGKPSPLVFKWRDTRSGKENGVRLVLDPKRRHHLCFIIDPLSRRLVFFVNFEGFDNPLFADAFLGDETELFFEGVAASGKSFNEQVREARVWDRPLDAAEVSASAYLPDGPERELGYLTRRFEGAKDLKRALVIGNGGGADSIVADKYGAVALDAVEINPSSYRLMKGPYSRYIGDLFERPGFALHLEDGRSFVRRSPERFDVMSLFGVDSLNAVASGAYVLAESYLYTMEALSDYWDHLSPTGKLQVSRWHFPEYPRETLRLFVMARETLIAKGVAEPNRHLLVATRKNAAALDGAFATLLVSRNALSDQTLRRTSAWLDSIGYELLYDPLTPKENAYHAYVAAAVGGIQERFLSEYQFNIRPVTDDSPFFFQYGRWSHLLKPYPKGPTGYESIQGRWPFFTVLSLLALCALIITPTIWIAWRASRVNRSASRGAVLLYFSSIGLAFLFVEMVLIQKFVLVLGHPIYSMGLTIPTLLICAGLGSGLSSHLDFTRTKIVVPYFLGLCGMLLLFQQALPTLLNALLQTGEVGRFVGVALSIAPLGVLMGIPFPAAISALREERGLIPLAWAANAGMSVLASVLAVLVSMELGFDFLLGLATFCYAGACVSAVRWSSVQVAAPSGVRQPATQS